MKEQELEPFVAAENDGPLQVFFKEKGKKLETPPAKDLAQHMRNVEEAGKLKKLLRR